MINVTLSFQLLKNKTDLEKKVWSDSNQHFENLVLIRHLNKFESVNNSVNRQNKIYNLVFKYFNGWRNWH